MTTPPPATPQIVTPTPEETQAIADSAHAAELRALAQELIKSGQLSYDPSTLVKGEVTAINYTSSPPTITITIGGETSTEVSDVRILNNYSPEVGHTVLIAKQGPSIVVLGHIADLAAMRPTGDGGEGGWIKAELSRGAHTVDNVNGSVYYRRILDHGSWKMQWQGGWDCSGLSSDNSLMLDAGVLPTEFIPQFRRIVPAARDTAGGAPAAQWVFDNNGGVWVDGAVAAPQYATSFGENDYANTDSGAESTTHTHGYVGGTTGLEDSLHSHNIIHSHTFTGGSHHHLVTFPAWVSLNGCEYFL